MYPPDMLVQVTQAITSIAAERAHVLTAVLPQMVSAHVQEQVLHVGLYRTAFVAYETLK